MNAIGETVRHGARFVREHPQLLYTLFLLVAIPIAFIASGEQFVGVSRDTQDRLERSRAGLLADVFAEFAQYQMSDPARLSEHIQELQKGNETITGFRVIVPESENEYRVLASLDPEEENTLFTPGILDQLVLDSAHRNKGQSYASEEYQGGLRHWRVARAISTPPPVALGTSTAPRVVAPEVAGYVLADVSMAEGDRLTEKNITKAYLILAGVVLLILLLLARQARIIDYATLYRRLKEVDQMKDDFVAMAAHELRSPLAIIRAYVDSLDDEKTLSEGGHHILEKIDGAAKDLNLLIGDILDVAKLQEGRMSFRFESVDPSDTIEKVVESFRMLAADKKLAFTYDKKALAPISVDTDRLRQVLVNIIGNAVKYTPAGSVAVTASVLAGERVEIRVSDTGIGISAEDQQKLFQKFFRVKSADTAKITGTGLGLWITGEIVRQMKGTISVESIRGKGSDFIVSFSVAKN